MEWRRKKKTAEKCNQNAIWCYFNVVEECDVLRNSPRITTKKTGRIPIRLPLMFSSSQHTTDFFVIDTRKKINAGISV